MRKRGFTLIELIIVFVVILVGGSILVIGGCWAIRGCTGQLSDNLIVNPYHSSTAQIKVLGAYFGSTDAGNLYRVVGGLVQDSDGGTGTETFEVSDSFIDGNFRTADLFGELLLAVGTEQVFQMELRGERSGISGGGSFRQIHSITRVGELD